MTEQEVRRYLRQMKEEDSERAFKGFYDLTYDRLFRIAYYYVRDEDAAQQIVLDVFMRLWQMRDRLPEVNSIEDYCLSSPRTPHSTIWSVKTGKAPCRPNTCPNRPTQPHRPKKP